MNGLIESGDPRAKVVGKRRIPHEGSESLEAGGKLNRLVTQLRERPIVVKQGVHRFKSYEKANEWMMKLMIR
jgi:hypothetical protein